MVAQNLKTTKKKGDTHDTGKRRGTDTASLQHGNNPHNLPNPDASRADFSHRKTLLKTTT